MKQDRYNLEQVGAAFDAWRSSRRDGNSPIPKELWAMVDNIYHHYSRGSICQRLGVSTSQLKRRGYGVDDTATAAGVKSASSSTAFIHVPPTEPSQISPMTSIDSSLLEVIRPDGTTIRLQHVPLEHLSQFFQQLVGG